MNQQSQNLAELRDPKCKRGNLRFSLPSLMLQVSMALLCFLASPLSAADVDEFKIKREEVFQFTAEPQVALRGKQYEILFTSKGYCDVTVAIEDASGRIVRHLASGVLGENAPPPLEANSLQQTLIWDGKDDRGRYVDNPGSFVVRVSLGLKPRFERSLFFSPKKRITRSNRPLVAAAAEGVFVFEGEGVDHLRMFDHQGEYLETIYPFAAGKLGDVKGLETCVFPQSGKTLPLKHGLVQATLLTSGRNTQQGTLAKYQCAASAMAVAGKRIALASDRLNRLDADGTTGGLNLEGPATAVMTVYRKQEVVVPPRSAALSPDGRWLYLTGYMFKPDYPRPHHWLPCVTRLDFAAGEKLELFAGSSKLDEVGSDDAHFKTPTSVACDAQGRVYVADYMNDRIQVFAPDGRLVRTIAVNKPAEIAVHQETGEVYAGSWMMLNRFSKPNDVEHPVIERLPAIDAPAASKPVVMPLPLEGHHPQVFMNKFAGMQFGLALDSWTDPPTIWLVPGAAGSVSKLAMVRGKMSTSAEEACIRLLVERDGKLEVKQDFGREVAEEVVRAKPPIHSRQKLFVNPTNGRLYVFEGQAGVAKSSLDLLEIDPETGAIRPFPLPFDAEDLAFDIDGLIYLRTDNVVGRFLPDSWREVPFDYGEERKSVGFSSSRDGRRTDLIGALVLPAQRPGCFHQGGMNVSPHGNLVVSCYNHTQPIDRRGEMREIQEAAKIAEGRKYTPQMFPGRVCWNEVHVWDRHGQLLLEDAVAGATMMDGIAIDKENCIYLLGTPNRVLDGKPYFLERAETLIKTRPRQARLASGKQGLSLPLEAKPDRPPDLQRAPDGPIWIEGQQWLYGGVGFGGFNSAKGGGGCACWHARFALDYFGRSFAPEVDHFTVAVLDTAGNLILRVGRYGNVDDGMPLVKDDRIASRSIGDDETALFHAAYVATHTDRRLFISDAGNARIVSVKLDYHKTARVKVE
jgi:hypothetical protein